MEVLTPPTPTYSGNYKVFLETLQDEARINFVSRYLSGMRSFWPAERSTEARELAEMISETSERTSEPLERRLASDHTVSPGATVTVIKEPAATGADVVPAPAFALTTEPKTIARERTTKVRAKRPRRLRVTVDGLV